MSDDERSTALLRDGQQDWQPQMRQLVLDANASSACCHLVLYRHLPKTGGSSLRKWLLDVLPHESWSLQFPWWNLGAQEDVLTRVIRRDRAVDRWLHAVASGGLPTFNLAVEYHARTDGAEYFLDVLRRARGLEGRLERSLLRRRAPQPRLPRVHTLLLLREPHAAVESFRRYSAHMRDGVAGATLEGFCRRHSRFQSSHLLMRSPATEAARAALSPNCSSLLACQLRELLATASGGSRPHPWRDKLRGAGSASALDSGARLEAGRAFDALLGRGGLVGTLEGLGGAHGLAARFCDAIHPRVVPAEASFAAARCRSTPIPHLLRNLHAAKRGAARCPLGTLDADEAALYREAQRRDSPARVQVSWD